MLHKPCHFLPVWLQRRPLELWRVLSMIKYLWRNQKNRATLSTHYFRSADNVEVVQTNVVLCSTLAGIADGKIWRIEQASRTFEFLCEFDRIVFTFLLEGPSFSTRFVGAGRLGEGITQLPVGVGV